MPMENEPQDGPSIFWGEIAPCDHLLHLYSDDAAFLESLEGFVSSGLEAGEGVVVIATEQHLKALDQRLRDADIDLWGARNREQYIALDAQETLDRFTDEGWPDAQRFESIVSGIIDRARGNSRPVRAFGEMVALLWERGHSGGTVRLEHLWNELCRTKMFSLLCAYPRIGFTQDADASMREICATHSRLIS